MTLEGPRASWSRSNVAVTTPIASGENVTEIASLPATPIVMGGVGNVEPKCVGSVSMIPLSVTSDEPAFVRVTVCAVVVVPVSTGPKSNGNGDTVSRGVATMFVPPTSVLSTVEISSVAVPLSKLQ